MLDALGAPEADLVVHREAISGFRTDSLLLAEFAHSYLTFCSDTLMKCQKQHIRLLDLTRIMTDYVALSSHGAY